MLPNISFSQDLLFVNLINICIFYGEGFNIKDCWLSINCYLLWLNLTYIRYIFILAINRVYRWKKKDIHMSVSVLAVYVLYSYIQNPYWVCIYRPILCIFWFMVFNATFNNISVILWRSVLLVEETGENHWPVTSHWQTLSHNVVLSTPYLSRIRTHNISGDMHWLHR